MPMLYMQLRFGSIWGTNFVDADGDEVKRNWNDLLTSIHNEECIPVLGPDLLEPLIGSPRDFANDWALDFEKNYKLMPFEGSQRYNLTTVAQYIATFGRNPIGVKTEYLERMRLAILRRYGAALQAKGVNDAEAKRLPQLIETIGERLSIMDTRTETAPPYAQLAELPFPIVVSANPDSLLTVTMAEQARRGQSDKEPETATFLWNRDLNALRATKSDQVLSNYNDNGKKSPTPQHPLIYHLLGRLEVPESLVLTEDDYFDYLMHINVNPGTPKKGDYYVPTKVVLAMQTWTMLFLGFQMDDWSFRVLLRSIAYLGDNARAYARPPGRLTIAVQIDPQVEDRDPNEVRSYLKNQYQNVANIRIYWGSTLQFINELCADYRMRYGSHARNGGSPDGQ
jgi:hypothetical protein